MQKLEKELIEGRKSGKRLHFGNIHIWIYSFAKSQEECCNLQYYVIKYTYNYIDA